MKRKTFDLLLAAVLMAAVLSGCGSSDAGKDTTEAPLQTGQEQTETPEETMSDQEAADEVAAMIDAIYVQSATDDTPDQCVAAREAWDALTDVQKELVEGVNADPDYFGRDTGDAALDDPRNEDGIGDREILVVSFGTSFNDSRVLDIKGVEDAIAAAYPHWGVRRAFTSQIIINHIYARDDEQIDNMDRALERSVENGVKQLIVQPTHLMHGAEYDELVEAVSACSDDFDEVIVAEPLLGEVGADGTSVNTDKEAVARAVVAAAVSSAGFDTLDDMAGDGTALVLMGHGTSHTAKISYTQMQNQMADLGYDNVFIGTVEGEPEDTACEAVLEAVNDAGYTKVILRPFMVVAGDHANNDMAGDDEDSWLTQFLDSGYFDEVEVQIEGLGRIPAIQEIYVSHTADAMKSAGLDSGEDAGSQNDEAENDTAAASYNSAGAALEDGTYLAKFQTDSSMFHVNEAMDGCGILTVADGGMTIHVSLTAKGIVNLYPGPASEALEDEAGWLEPTLDEVTYPDGTTEEVYGFDIPVPATDEEFDVAILGTKGIWYDHKVSVSDPVPEE